MSEPLGELILVLVIVGAVAVLSVRSLYRLMAGRDSGKCSGCASCSCRDADRKTE